MKKLRLLPRKQVYIAAAILVTLIACSAVVTTYAMSVRTVLVVDNGEETTINTTRSDWQGILRSRGVTLSERDYVDLSSFNTVGDCVIRIHRVAEVTLIDNDETQVLAVAGSVQRLLDIHDIELGTRDVINVEVREILSPGMEIVISRAFDVLVTDGETEYSVAIAQGDVQDALEFAGILLEEDDFTEPEIEADLYPGMEIKIMRVVYREREFTRAIDFAVQTRDNPEAYLGNVRVEQRGVRGEERMLYSDRYINGVRVDSILLEEEVLTEPTPEIRVRGIRVARLTPGLTPISSLTPPAGLNIVNGRPTNMVRTTHTGMATAYTYYGQGITATGVPARLGHVAVNPNIIPYGSHLWIVSNDGRYVYGYAIAVDTGGFVRHNPAPIVDIYVPNTAFARSWGRRAVTVYVLDIPRARLPWNQRWNPGELYSHRIARR